MKTDLIEMKAIGKRLGSKAHFLEIECSERFIEKAKKDYGLIVEYNEKELTIFYNENRTETVDVESVKDDNLVMFLMKQKQGNKDFFMMCPFWYINKNYNII